MKHHRNHIILHDGSQYHLFERMGKKVPFEAYNPQKSLFSSENLEEVLENPRKVSLKIQGSRSENLGEVSSKSWGSFLENPRKSICRSLGIPFVPRWDIEGKPIEVMFND